jgi:hypothetical protein
MTFGVLVFAKTQKGSFIESTKTQISQNWDFSFFGEFWIFWKILDFFEFLDFLEIFGFFGNFWIFWKILDFLEQLAVCHFGLHRSRVHDTK